MGALIFVLYTSSPPLFPACLMSIFLVNKIVFGYQYFHGTGHHFQKPQKVKMFGCFYFQCISCFLFIQCLFHPFYFFATWREIESEIGEMHLVTSTFKEMYLLHYMKVATCIWMEMCFNFRNTKSKGIWIFLFPCGTFIVPSAYFSISTALLRQEK